LTVQLSITQAIAQIDLSVDGFLPLIYGNVKLLQAFVNLKRTSAWMSHVSSRLATNQYCLPATDEAVALARFAQEKLGRLDIWVNNAGVP
jgi:NAD(P)-dependent dehydrogenase (short-subunit alcohol dehydrogenase family)